MVDFMGDVLFLFLVLLTMGVVGGLIYKWRDGIKDFFKDPEVGSEFHLDRKKILARKIENAQDEIAWLDKKEKKDIKPETEGE